MNRIFGFSRNAIALTGIVVAIILVVLVGFLIISSAAIRAMMVPGMKVEGISTLALLVAIIVLLTACFVMLLALLWCCCRRDHGKRDSVPPDLLAVLLPMLPMLRPLPDIMSDLGVALYQAGKTLGWIQGNISDAARALNDAAMNVLAGHRIPLLKQTEINGVPVLTVEWVNPIDPLLEPLRELSKRLEPALAQTPPVPPVVVEYASAPDATMAHVSQTLQDVGKLLATLARDLHADRDPPSELLNP